MREFCLASPRLAAAFEPDAGHHAFEDAAPRIAAVAGARPPLFGPGAATVGTCRSHAAADAEADARTGQMIELWRSAMFSEEFKSVVTQLDEAVAAVEEAEMRIKRLSAGGTISVVQGEQLSPTSGRWWRIRCRSPAATPPSRSRPSPRRSSNAASSSWA